jgi:hypothetical protein
MDMLTRESSLKLGNSIRVRRLDTTKPGGVDIDHVVYVSVSTNYDSVQQGVSTIAALSQSLG